MARPHPITWLRTHVRIADALLAVLVTAMAITLHLADFDDADEFREPTWWTTILVTGSTLPVAWRRVTPIGAGLFVVAVQIVTAFVDIDGSGFLGVVIALYSIGAHSTGPRRSNALIAIAAALVLLFTAGLIADHVNIGDFIGSTVILVTAFVLGDNLRRRRERADGLVERAERAEREQELIAHQRVNAERTRIARELHDVVAHSVSVMVIQAAAARRSLRAAPDNAEAALVNIEDTGRQTMNELRGILGVLRQESVEDSAKRVPQPTLTDLDHLITGDSDLPIELEVIGSLDDLSHSVALTGYRVVQESLTNVRRHAGPVGRVAVRIERDTELLDITIGDDGRGAAADNIGPGYGIVGMTERVGASGGTITAGPRPGGGWRVHASIPTHSAAAAHRERASTAPRSGE